jgi:hypothetical protein
MTLANPSPASSPARASEALELDHTDGRGEGRQEPARWPAAVDLGRWTWRGGLGMFESSTGFRLLDGSVRSPDAALVRLDSWRALTPEARAVDIFRGG